MRAPSIYVPVSATVAALFALATAFFEVPGRRSIWSPTVVIVTIMIVTGSAVVQWVICTRAYIKFEIQQAVAASRRDEPGGIA
jgi:hypothetical protein